MSAMWPWERHNVSELLFSHIENVDNTCLIYFIVSCEDKTEKQFKIIKLYKNVKDI